MTNKLSFINTVLHAAVVICLIIMIIVLATLPSRLGVALGDADSANAVSEKVKTVSTPYGDLKFPSEYHDYLKVVEKKADGLVTEAFYSTFTGEDVELYTFYFGTTEKGFNVGYILVDGAMMPINVNITDLEQKEDWSDDEYYILMAMQETVNDVISSAHEIEGFVEG